MSAQASRNRDVDVLRGVAILMVLLLHFGETYSIWDKGPVVAVVGANVAWSILGWSNFGVTMFFVVSGYLITSNAMQRFGSLGRISLRPFYVRRAARILPCVVLALCIIVPLGLLGVPSFASDAPHGRYLLLGALSVLGFFHNLLMQHLGYFDYCLNVYWSLSVEEVFYIALPLVCLLLRRDALIMLPCLALIAIAPFYRAAHLHNDIFYLYANLACFDAISIGCLTALLARRWTPSGGLAYAFRTFGWVALVFVWYRGFGGTHKVFAFTWLALATSAVITGSLDSTRTEQASWLAGRAIRWLGRHSYEIYLFHIIVLAAMRDVVAGDALGPAWQVPWLLLFLSLSCLIAREVARRWSEPANTLLRGVLLRQVE